jgi:Fur family ferric uptake transcriptional regulator
MRTVINMPTERTSDRGSGAAPRAGVVALRTALVAHLEQRGLKHSRQRELVAEVFFDAGGHVAVEELTRRVRAEDPRVSVATVYRTMKLLSECGLAVARQFDGGQTRYEPGAGRAHHDHLICTSCGEIVEFANPRIEALQVRVAASHGFEVASHKLELYGRCARCRRAPRAPAGEAR